MKKVLSMLLVLTMLLSFSISAYAEVSDEITPRGIPCVCGGSMTPISTTYTSWNRDSQVSCPHSNLDHVRYVYKRTKTTTWQCNNCSFSRDQTNEETKTDCTVVNHTH